MKKLILTTACAMTALIGSAQSTITAKLTNLASDTVVVSIIKSNMRGYEGKDTLVAKNGEFTYSFNGSKARLAFFEVTIPSGPTRIPLYLVPSEQGVVEGAAPDVKVSGTKFYKDMAAYEAMVDPVADEIQALVSDFEAKVAAGGDKEALRNSVMPKYQELSAKRVAIIKDYIKANPSNDFTATLLNETDDAEAAMLLLTDNVKNGVFSDIVATVQKQIDAEKARLEAAKKVADGMMAPDFTLKDLDGKDLALSSLRGKYVILDFWGAWCGWCIKGFPDMKAYYAKYSDKLEILGVDCNDTEQKWRDAVKKHELPWKHVYNPRKSDLLTTYAIQGFPTKIIIDPQGKIVKTVVGEDPAFYTILDELMK